MLSNNQFHKEFGKHNMQEFQFENGETLNDVNVEFYVFGTPKFNEYNEIINAVIYCHGYDTDYTGVSDIYSITNENDPLDKNEYFFISINTLGFPNSCSPSTTELNFNFPQYTVKDMVNFKRQFLKEKYNLNNIHGVLGYEMGGYEVFTWACEYPDEMDFIIIAGSAFKTSGYKYILAKTIENIIESEDYYGAYNTSITERLITLNLLAYPQYKSKNQLENMTTDEIDLFLEDYVEEGLSLDIYDIKYRNHAVMHYNVEDKLKNIKAKSLIFCSPNDIYFSLEHDALPLKELINDCELIIHQEHDFDHNDPSIAKDIISNFLKDIHY